MRNQKKFSDLRQRADYAMEYLEKHSGSSTPRQQAREHMVKTEIGRMHAALDKGDLRTAEDALVIVTDLLISWCRNI